MTKIRPLPIAPPAEASKPPDPLLRFVWLFYGPEKIGKTSLLPQFPDTIFLLCETGAKTLSIHKKDIKNWCEFLEAINAFMEDNRFKTVVIDTLATPLN